MYYHVALHFQDYIDSFLFFSPSLLHDTMSAISSLSISSPAFTLGHLLVFFLLNNGHRLFTTFSLFFFFFFFFTLSPARPTYTMYIYPTSPHAFVVHAHVRVSQVRTLLLQIS